jgi:hypothetical protein
MSGVAELGIYDIVGRLARAPSTSGLPVSSAGEISSEGGGASHQSFDSCACVCNLGGVFVCILPQAKETLIFSQRVRFASGIFVESCQLVKDVIFVRNMVIYWEFSSERRLPIRAPRPSPPGHLSLLD